MLYSLSFFERDVLDVFSGWVLSLAGSVIEESTRSRQFPTADLSFFFPLGKLASKISVIENGYWQPKRILIIHN